MGFVAVILKHKSYYVISYITMWISKKSTPNFKEI